MLFPVQGTTINGVRTSWMGSLSVALLVALLTACGGARFDYARSGDLAIEETPLGGEALLQRTTDLRRAFDDMVAFQLTMSELIDRRDSRGLAVFDDFVAQYVGQHLDPLLVSSWQSSHPETMAVDANLRFVKADVLVQMRYPRRVQDVIDDIEMRYEGRKGILVDYPIGQQTPLGDALEILKHRKWDG
jgi:hypothetical protein